MNIFPEAVSTYAHEMDKLFWLITLFAGLGFFITIGILIYALIRFRYSPQRKPMTFRGNTFREFRWVALGMALLAFADFYVLYDEHDTWDKMMQTVPEEKDLHIAITGRQWNWIFTYPGPDGKLYTADDVIINEPNSTIHVPIHKNVVFDIRSVDVIHSVFLKEARFKYDAIPGRTITKWVQFHRPGKYELICAELCGVLHSKMRNFIMVESEEVFQQWLDELYAGTNE